MTFSNHAASTANALFSRLRDLVPLRRLAVVLCAVLLVLPSLSTTASAQSMLRDAETEAFLHDISRPIFNAAGLDPRSIEFYLINDQSPNAFVTLGQNIFIHSGLILYANDVDELIGVIAHETGHIAGGHAVRFGDGIKEATGITLLSLLLAAGAFAGGAGDAGAAILAGGQTVATGRFLAYSRVQESAADQAAATYLDEAGVSGKGFIRFFETLRSLEYNRGIQQSEYFRSHPLTTDRIARIEERLSQSPVFEDPPDPEFNRRFLRIKAKLAGYIRTPEETLRDYPPSDTSEAAHYARAYAWHKSAYTDRAANELEALLQMAPEDPYFLELKGQVLLESGDPAKAISYLRSAYEAAPEQPLIGGLLGHALLATDDEQYTDEALTILKSALQSDPDNPFAWYQLGIAYSRSGDDVRAALASAERYSRTGEHELAVRNARKAADALPEGTPEWLKAQDILSLSGDAARKQQKERRRRG